MPGGRNILASLDQATLLRLQEEVEAEKKALITSKDMVVEQKQRIAQELEARAQELEKERQDREALANELQSVEAKLLIGGVNIFDHVNAQERELEEKEVFFSWFILATTARTSSCRVTAEIAT